MARLSKDAQFQAAQVKVNAASTLLGKFLAARASDLGRAPVQPFASDKDRKIATVLALQVLQTAYNDLSDSDYRPNFAPDTLAAMVRGDYRGLQLVGYPQLKKVHPSLASEVAAIAEGITPATRQAAQTAAEADKAATAAALKQAPLVKSRAKTPAFQAAKAAVDAANNLSDKLRASRAGDLYLYGPLSDEDRRLYGTLTTIVLQDALSQLPDGVYRPGFAAVILKGQQGRRDRPLATLAEVGNPDLEPAVDALRTVDAPAATLVSGWIRGAGEQLEQRQLNRAVERATDWVQTPVAQLWQAIPTPVKIALAVGGAVYLWRRLR